MKNECCFYVTYVTLCSGVFVIILGKLENVCRKWRQVKSTIQSSIKWLITENKVAFFKSLFLLNGKK